MSALWTLLATLPLTPEEHTALGYFLAAAGAVERVQDFIDRDGALALRFTLRGRGHSALLRPT